MNIYVFVIVEGVIIIFKKLKVYLARTAILTTGPDGAVVKPSANGLVGTVFTSWYRLQLRAGF